MTQLLTFCLASFLIHFLLMFFYKQLTFKKICEALFFSPTTLIVFLHNSWINLFTYNKQKKIDEMKKDCLILYACIWTIVILKTVNLI